MEQTETKVDAPTDDYAFLLKENVRILLQAYRDIHRRVFGFSWRKVFPFVLYYRRVDYTAYSHLLNDIALKLDEQSEASHRPPPEARTQEHKAFFVALDQYVQLLRHSAEILREISLQILDKAPWKSLRAEIDRYEKSCSAYTAHAPLLNEKYTKMRARIRADQPRAEASE